MPIEMTYADARENLNDVLDQVVENREPVIIRRQGGSDVALIAADELAGLMETAHLLRSPKNAQRLLNAYRDAKAGKGEPQSVDDLRRELGLDDED